MWTASDRSCSGKRRSREISKIAKLAQDNHVTEEDIECGFTNEDNNYEADTSYIHGSAASTAVFLWQQIGRSLQGIQFSQ